MECTARPLLPQYDMKAWDLGIVAASALALIAIAAYMASRQRDAGDYYLGGGRLPAWALGLSLAANQVSAISLVGAPAFVALREGGGLVWLQYELAVPLALAALALWGVPLLRQARHADVYSAVEHRLGRSARRFLATLFLLGRGLGAGVVLYTSSLVVDACSGWGLPVSLLVVAGVAIAYTGLGGLVADVFTDVLQLGLLWAGSLAATCYLAWQLRGRDTLLAGVDPERLVALDFGGHGLGDGATFAFWPMLVGGFFLYLSYYGCDQTQAQRILAAGDEAAARRALLIAALVRFPLVLTYCCLGLLLGALLAADPAFAQSLAGLPADALVPRFIVSYLPTGLLGLAVAGILAAALSSLDSALNSLSAVTTAEILPLLGDENSKISLLWARLGTLAWGLWATGCAWWFAQGQETVIEMVNRVGSLFYGPMLAVFLLAWGSRRATGRSAVLGGMAGVAVNLLLSIAAPGVSWLWWNPIGCLTALLLGQATACGRQRRGHDGGEPSGEPLARPDAAAGDGRRWPIAAALLLAFCAILLLLGSTLLVVPG